MVDLLAILKQSKVKMVLNESIRINFQGEKKQIKKYIIHKFVIVRVQTETMRSREWSIKVAIKKHEYAKDWELDVTVFSKYHGENLSFGCSGNWSDWRFINNGETNFYYDININVTLDKLHSHANIKFHEDETLTDFQLCAEDGSVAVHRAYLAAHSDVFKTMLHGQWKETAEGRVELKGVTRQTLQHFKDFIYLGMLPDDGLCPLLLLAARYLVDNLKTDCIMKVLESTTAENLDARFEFAVENEMQELIDNLLDKIPANIFVSAYAIRIKTLMGKKDDEE